MIKNQVQSYLQDKLKTKVIIGSVDYRLPEWIEINNVYIEDKQKDTLIFYLAEKLTENWYKELAGATGFGYVLMPMF